MKYSRLERLYMEKNDNEDKWLLSFCASHILGLAPILWTLPHAWLTYPIYTVLFMIFWKKVILK